MMRGKVTSVDATGVYVQTAEFGVLGPCQAVVANYAVGDMVLCDNVGDGASPDLVVVGRLTMVGSGATPASTTDNAVARFDGTSGALQNSGVTINDNGVVSGGPVDSRSGSYNYITATSDSGDVYLTAKAANASGSGFIYHEYLNGGTKYFQHKISANTLSMQYRSSGGTQVPWIEVDRNTNPGRVTIYQPGTAAGIELGASGPTITTGTGAPSHSAPNGSLYLRTDGTASTTLYVRAGGAWSALS